MNRIKFILVVSIVSLSIIINYQVTYGQNQTNEAKYIECIENNNKIVDNMKVQSPESATFDLLYDMLVHCYEIRQGYEGYKGDYYCLNVSKFKWEECQFLKVAAEQNESQ